MERILLLPHNLHESVAQDLLKREAPFTLSQANRAVMRKLLLRPAHLAYVCFRHLAFVDKFLITDPRVQDRLFRQGEIGEIDYERAMIDGYINLAASVATCWSLCIYFLIGSSLSILSIITENSALNAISQIISVTCLICLLPIAWQIGRRKMQSAA